MISAAMLHCAHVLIASDLAAKIQTNMKTRNATINSLYANGPTITIKICHKLIIDAMMMQPDDALILFVYNFIYFLEFLECLDGFINMWTLCSSCFYFCSSVLNSGQTCFCFVIK